jgi:hypothetical protein
MYLHSEQTQAPPFLGKKGNGLGQESLVDAKPVQDTKLRVQDETPCEGDGHDRSDIWRDEEASHQSSARELAMHKKGSDQSQEDRESASSGGIDQSGDKDRHKIRSAKYLLEVHKSKVNFRKRYVAKTFKRNRLDTKPQIPNDREHSKAQDHGKGGEQHPEGQFSLLIR